MFQRVNPIFFLALLFAQLQTSAAIRVDWDRSTLTLLQHGGAYSRMMRVPDGLLCCFEFQGRCWVRHSVDEGKTWNAAVEAASFEFGHAANPEMLCCQDGRILLFYNQRPSDYLHRFSIAMTASRDNGKTWTASRTLYSAGTSFGQGCYEPAAIQLPSGQIQLLFANEYPHRDDGSQEISMIRSDDDGDHWSTAAAVSYRARHRDGMPVPIFLPDQKTIAFAIEDNGLTPDNEFKPSIIRISAAMDRDDKCIAGDSALRHGAVDQKWPDHLYAGAPYLRQLSTGETLLSCQLADGKQPRHMVVYIGDAQANHFAQPSQPFPDAEKTHELWNSLFVKSANTVTAISTTKVDGVPGVWAIDGHIYR